MSSREVVVRGALTADGDLVLDEKPDLPPGRVEVTVRLGHDTVVARGTMVEVLRTIWAELDARGHEGRSHEEIVAEVRALRDDWDERDLQLERDQGGDALRFRRAMGARVASQVLDFLRLWDYLGPF